MNFENAQYLKFLPAAVLPLIIYLIFRKKPDKLIFSSVYLLKNISEKVRIRTRFKDILLLLIRTLSIVALILFFAGPFKGEISSFDPSKRTVSVIYLDTSPSMSDEMNGSDKLTNASQNALRSIAGAEKNGIFYIFTSDTERKFKGGRSDAVKFISETERYGSERPFGDFLLLADSVFNSHNDVNKLLLVFTDGKINLGKSITAEQDYYSRAVVFSSENENDISIDSAGVLNGNELVFFLRSPSLNTALDVFADGQKIYSSPVEFTDRSTKPININAPSFTGPSLLINAQIKDASNISNNNYYLVIPRTESKNILIAGDTTSVTIKSISALINSENKSSLKTETADPKNLSSYRFEDFDAVFLTELPVASSYLSSALKRYVSSGGSLFMIAGNNFNLNDYSSNLAPRLTLPQAEGYEDPGNSYFNIEISSPGHYIFKNVFDGNFKELSSVEIYTLYKFKAAGWNVIIKAGGYPLLIEKDVGAGKIILMASGLEKTGSNIIENGIAVPIIFNTLSYLAGNEISEGVIHTVGQKLKLDKIFAMVENSEQYYPGRHELSSEFLLQKEGFYNMIDPEGTILRTVAVNNEREKYPDNSKLLSEIFSDVIQSDEIDENTKLISPDKKLFSKHLLFLILILAAADIIIVRKM